jgi:hypothetical protein
MQHLDAPTNNPHQQLHVPQRLQHPIDVIRFAERLGHRTQLQGLRGRSIPRIRCQIFPHVVALVLTVIVTVSLITKVTILWMLLALLKLALALLLTTLRRTLLLLLLLLLEQISLLLLIQRLLLLLLLLQ